MTTPTKGVWKMGNYRYQVMYDPDPDLSYLEQIGSDGELLFNQNPEDIVSYGVIQELQCPCCETWDEVDSVWGFDVDEVSSDNIGEGTYDSMYDLPPFMQEHFREDEDDE